MAIGPSTTTSPYLLGYEPNVRFTSIATVGDVIGTNPNGSPYRMVGIPDGLGSFDNGDGTITVVMNHELGATQGVVRAHGAIGSFVSQLVIDKNTLSVVSAKDAISNLYLWDRFDADSDGITNEFQSTPTALAINRLCSADLAAPSAYYWVDDMGTTDTSDDVAYGTQDRIFMTGEEFSPAAATATTPEILGGREFGVVLTGAEAGTAYELAHMGYFAWENAITSTYAQKKTINISMDDGTNGQVYVYIGDKQTTGNAVEKAGLTGGNMYGIRVQNLAGNNNNESSALAASGRFDLYNEGDVSGLTGLQLDALSEANGVTSFLRPEDGQFDPSNPNDFYFVTTNGFGQPSRLYRLRFDDITNPEAGGEITAVLDGTEGQQMLDNMTITPQGKIILQEDVGNNAHIGKVWEYDIATDTLKQIASHDPAHFSGSALTNPNFSTLDEESSGVIDVTSMLGDADTKAYLLDVQSHNGLIDPELVQGGQLLAMFVDTPVTVGTKSDDHLFGSAADETFTGDAGNDEILAGSGNDILKGGSGNDILYGGAGDDKLDSGAGVDYLDGGDGNDSVIGGSGVDTMLGGLGNDKLEGKGEADLLDGGDGIDSLKGGSESDILIGGAGKDTLYGGSEADIFRYLATTESSLTGGIDIIKDFSHLAGDKVDLSLIDADTITAGDQAFTVVSQFHAIAGELFITHDNASNYSIYADTNGDAVADLIISVTTQNHWVLAGNDLML